MVNPWYNCVWSSMLKISALHLKKIQRDVLGMALLCMRSWSNWDVWKRGNGEKRKRNI